MLVSNQSENDICQLCCLQKIDQDLCMYGREDCSVTAEITELLLKGGSVSIHLFFDIMLMQQAHMRNGSPHLTPSDDVCFSLSLKASRHQHKSKGHSYRAVACRPDGSPT